MTRNINGNANVKNAEAGLRQNALLTYRIWVKVRGAAESRSRGDRWRRRAGRTNPASELGGRRLPRAQRCDRGHRDGRGRRATADSGHDRRPATGTVPDGGRRDWARRSLCRAGRRRAAMSGFAAFAGKEAREILRTWRIWILPGILLFFALTGQVL